MCVSQKIGKTTIEGRAGAAHKVQCIADLHLKVPISKKGQKKDPQVLRAASYASVDAARSSAPERAATRLMNHRCVACYSCIPKILSR